MGASRGCGGIGCAGEKTDFADVVAGPNKAHRLLPRKLVGWLISRIPEIDNEERGFSASLREQYLSGFERSRL